MVNLTNIYRAFMQYSVVYTVSSCRYSINTSGINGRIILNLKSFWKIRYGFLFV